MTLSNKKLDMSNLFTGAAKLKPYLWSFIAAVVITAIGQALHSIITPTDQALIYLSGVVLVAANLHPGPSFLYVLLSVACLNFFFIPPLYSFTVYDRSYWLTFAVMIITGFVITNQAARLRLQQMTSLKRERTTLSLYALTKQLTSTRGREDISKVTAKHIIGMFGVNVTIWLVNSEDRLKPIYGNLPPKSAIKEMSVLQWCFDNQHIAGRHTTTLPSALGLYFPIISPSGTLGVIGVLPQDYERQFTDEDITSLETCSSLLASALERANISILAEESKLEAESERLRTMLLSSVSHDLRTPLASITGASSTIVTDYEQMTDETILELSRSIKIEAERLSHIIRNLLEVTRLESGTIRLNKQPYYAEELIGSVLERQRSLLSKHIVVTKSDDNLPHIFVDGVLIEQVIDNLLENAVYYTPHGSQIMIYVSYNNQNILIEVSDNGPGIPAGNEEMIFRKFYSLSHNKAQKGTGLGLAICASIIKAHEGRIWAENIFGGGAKFSFTLPVPYSAEQGTEHVANN